MSLDELNKIAGAFLGALLLFLLLGFFSEKLLGTGAHHDDTLAFALEIEEEGDTAAAEAPAVDLLALAQAADAGAGGGVFRQCSACHKIEDGANGVGPHLHAVVDRAIGSVAGYSYSDALSGHGGDWSVENLMAFLENPKGWAPGTKMAYNGLKKPEDRMNLIAYLNAESGAPVDLTAGLSGAEKASAEGAAEETAVATDATEEAAADDAATEEAAAEATTEDAAAEDATETAAADAAEEAATDTAEATQTEEAAAETAEATAAAETAEVTEEAATAEAAATEAEARTETAEAEAPAEAAEAEAPAETAEVAEEATEESAEEIVTAAADPEPAAEEAAAPSGMFAGVTAEDGQKVYRACRACHVVEDGKNRVGPHLYGVVGRSVASVDGFRYSDAMVAYGGEWSVERLDAYLENPRGVVKGTKMAYPGLKKAEDRAAVILYLNENSAAPLALE